MIRLAALPLIVLACLAGCQSAKKNTPTTSVSAQSPGNGRETAPRAARPVAYVNAQAVTSDDLLPTLYEAAGGEALADLILDQRIAARLTQRGFVVDAQALADEKTIILKTQSDDPDTAARLLEELRSVRGLGPVRFESLLRRNAGLRMLIEDQVEVTEAAVKQAYLLRYGPKYRVRLIVTQSAQDAARLRERAIQGEAFVDLAAMHSIDASAAQGGLLSPISPADPQYPQALRNALPKLTPDQPSPVIALSDRFAVLALEDKIDSQAVEFADVKQALSDSVRLRNQRLLMEQLARELLAEAEVIVLDPTLKPAWESQRKRLTLP